jgi:photosystem II stability/assembly factor-like uncharacterized protein
MLYVGTAGEGLYRSVDGGASWQRSSRGIDPNANIRSVAVNPQNNREVCAADLHTGVYFSCDGGESWTRATKGLRTRAVNRLVYSSDGKVLYAATEGEGVFRLDLVPAGG